MSASPDFYTEGNTPVRTDTGLRVNQKILGATRDGGGGGGGSNTIDGAGSPVGVKTPDSKNQFYRDTNAPGGLWISTGLTNADWEQIA